MIDYSSALVVLVVLVYLLLFLTCMRRAVTKPLEVSKADADRHQ